MNFVSKRYYFYAFSIVLTIIAVFGLLKWGLVLGVDFTGGNLLEVKFQYPVNVDEFKKTVAGLQIKDFNIQPAEGNVFRVSIPKITPDDFQNMKNIFLVSYGPFEELRFDSVGPTVSQTIRDRAFAVIILVLVLISLYIAYAFRQASRAVSSFRYGITTLIALFHDIFLTIGFYSFYSYFTGAFVDINFIVALLVILGFSVHDTIVVFDRIRENVLKTKASFEEVVNVSLNQTVIRSITTSLTTIIALFAVLFFGGNTLHPFVLSLIFGIAVGTYSSIFIASALLVDWHQRKIKN